MDTFMYVENIRAALSGIWRTWREGSLGRVENLLLSALAIGLFLCGGGYFFGRVCSAWYLAAGFAVTGIGALLISWRRFVSLAGLSALILVATAFTFSYTGTDALNYHYPMQRLLLDGWNPVFDSTIERFRALTGDTVTVWHTLFLPKGPHLCGALVSALTGLYAGDAFLGYALIVALLCAASRFAKSEWRCGAWMAALFAVSVTCSTKITSFLAGQVDYVTYAGFLAALFAYLVWRRERAAGDLLLAGLCLALTMLAKTTGLICGVFALLIALALDWRRAEFRWGCVVLALFVVVVGASPLLTAWVQYGAPFYPSMTFDPSVSTRDITADFTGNDDALAMGYLARIVYAWFSPTLATNACAWWLDRPDFAPVFSVVGGVGGLGGMFRLLLLLSIVALALSRLNAVTLLCVFLFVSANLAPLKYIGYARYFPQMWAIPFLAAFNFLYAPRPWITAWLGTTFRWGRAAIVAGILALTVLTAVRSALYQCRTWAFERTRQETFAGMRAQSEAWRLLDDSPHSFSLAKRMAAAGLRLTDDRDAPTFSLNRQFLMPITADCPDQTEALSNHVPICDSPGDFLHFSPTACFPPPHPLKAL